MSLIVFSLVTFAGSVSLPWLVRSPEDDEKPGFTPRPPPRIAPFLHTLLRNKPSLLGAWTAGHLIFAATMVFAPFVASLRSATFLVAICGIPWALACWAPFTYMGIEINRVNPDAHLPTTARNASYSHIANAPLELTDHEPHILHLRQPSITSSSSSEQPSSSTGELAGVYLGILNLYTTLPQFIATAISTIVFSVLEPGKSPELAQDAHPDEHHSTDGPNAIAVCLFVGALSSVGAAYATRRLRFVR